MMISNLNFKVSVDTPPPPHPTASLLIYISLICHSSIWEQTACMVDWLCCPRYYISITSSSLGRRRGLKNVLHACTHTRSSLMSELNSCTRGAPCSSSADGGCIIILQLSCVYFLLHCRCWISTPGGTLEPICTIADLRVDWRPFN